MKQPALFALAALAIVASCPVVSTIQAQEPIRHGYLEMYDVRDLVMARRDYPVKRLNQSMPEIREQDILMAASNRLLNEIRAALSAQNIPADTYSLKIGQCWPADRTAASVLIANASVLIAKGAHEVHVALAAFLKRARRLSDVIFHIETRIYRIRDPKRDLPERLLAEPLGDKDTMFLLNTEQARTLRQEMDRRAREKNRNLKIVAAPRITTQNGQRANTIIVNRLSYVADYRRIKVMGGQTDVLDPVIKCVEDGGGFDIKVTQDADVPDRARLEVFYQDAKLKRPVEERQTEHGVLQLPEVHTVNLQFTLNISLPGHVMLASTCRPECGVDLVLIKVQRDTLESLAGPKGVRLAPVVGLSRAHARDGKKRLIIEAGTRAGLEKDMAVRFVTSDRKDARALYTGRIERIHTDLAVAVLDGDPELDAAKAVTLLAGWNPARKKRR